MKWHRALVSVLLGTCTLGGCVASNGLDLSRGEYAREDEFQELRTRVQELSTRVDELDGTALLRKFPAPEWGEKRLQEILKREVAQGVYRNPEEAEFIAKFDTWKRARDRAAMEGGEWKGDKM